MEIWARKMPQVQFFCVCVESLGVAQMFDRMFRFEHAVNAYIPSRGYLPRGYGQLGCSGFIVSDAEGNFVSRKTKAYLQYGEHAFRDVEQLLAEQLSKTIVDKELEKREQVTVTCKADYLPPPIGIVSMDQEHESCAVALRILSGNPTEQNLRLAIKELEVHFAHEEALMIEHGFGGDGGPFSALKSHVQDHNRILELGRAELQRLSNLSSSCDMKTS